ISITITIILNILFILEKLNLLQYLFLLPQAMQNILLWFYKNIVQIEVNIWVVLLFALVLSKVKDIFVDKNDEEIVYQDLEEMSENHKTVFKTIAEIISNSEGFPNPHIRDYISVHDVENVELNLIINDLVQNKYIALEYNKFILTKKGEQAAMNLMSEIKKINRLFPF
ncbi:MAG: hypothetical protein GX170_01495, partial [Campylobacteraceae bacterium]|nr:hypothetical protein [Campylobacteraceae bacterium]